MTKTQISVRVTPDTLAAIDAEAERLGVSRGAIIDRWLGQQARANDTGIAYMVGKLTAEAHDAVGRGYVTLAVRNLCEAVDLLNGTAQDD